MIEIVVYGKAHPAGSKRAGVTRGGRPFVRDDAKGSRAWKQQVAQAAGERMDGEALLDGPLAVEMVFSVPRPKGHFGVRGLRPSAPAHPAVRPDLLKLARACEDAMTGVVYRDDAQIVREVLSKVYAERACVRIFVSPIGEHGSQLTTGQEPRREAA